MNPRTVSRIVTLGAVGFLLLDAVLFAIAERWIWAAVCGLAAVLVLLAWRRYRRVMKELADARVDMRREAESLRDLLEPYLRN